MSIVVPCVVKQFVPTYKTNHFGFISSYQITLVYIIGNIDICTRIYPISNITLLGKYLLVMIGKSISISLTTGLLHEKVISFLIDISIPFIINKMYNKHVSTEI